MRVMVTKSGGALSFVRHSQKSVGESGETEGLIRGLIALGCEVAYVGVVTGKPPPNVTVFDPDLGDWPDAYTPFDVMDGLEERYIALDRRVADWGPRALFATCGYASTTIWPKNPRHVITQWVGARYHCPPLHAAASLGIPRISVNSDPRTHPREQEMTDEWPTILPAALLGQCNQEGRRVVGGVPLRWKEVYAGVENWIVRPAAEPGAREWPMAIVAHAHIKDGIRNKLRQVPLDAMLAAAKTFPMPGVGKGAQRRESYAFGKGWGDDVVLNPGQVDYLLARTKCVPMAVSQPGFYTSKMRAVLLQGCLPLLWSDGPLTYDPDGLFVPLDDNSLRFRTSDELIELVKWYDTHEVMRRRVVEWLLERTKPDYSVLGRAVAKVADGTIRDDFELGGYRRG